MLDFNGYVAGWLNGTISDFLSEFPRGFEAVKYVLITCLDSDPAPALMLKNNTELGAAIGGATAVQNGLLVPYKSLQKASLRDQLFAGFDEIWFFPSDDVKPKPRTASIVGPHRIDRATIEELGEWLVVNDCLLGLGDGVGVNIIVKADGIAGRVIGHSLAQPEPVFQMSDLWVQDEDVAIASTKPARQLMQKKAERRSR